MAERPTFSEALKRLRTTGKQFDQKSSRIPLGNEFTHLDWKGEQVPALVDGQIIYEPAAVYAKDPLVQSRLNDLRGETSFEGLATYLRRMLQDPELIIGFSGYASDGFGYEVEADGMQEILRSFRQEKIGLVVDGGTSLGVPGLSGLIAKHEGFETLGILPLEGLRSVGPRETIIVLGKQYGDETELIGRFPDVLFIMGGGPNATREYLEALRTGNSVVMMKLKDYPANSLASTFETLSETQQARKTGQLTVCHKIAEISVVVNSLSIPSLAAIHQNRATKDFSSAT